MKLNLNPTAVLAVLMFVLIAPTTTVLQADDLSALVQENLGYVYGQTGYDGGHYSATDYARHRLAMGPGGYGYNRGYSNHRYGRRDYGYRRHERYRNNGLRDAGLVLAGAGGALVLDRVIRSRHEAEPEYRRVLPPREQQPEGQATAPTPKGVQVVNETACTVVIYAGKEQFMLNPGEVKEAPANFQDITAWGKFAGDKPTEGQVLQGKDGVVRIKTPV